MTMFPGSRWWKVDFHAHTPASVCYGRGHPNEQELKRYPLKDWLLDYMKAGIDCVAVTDHNCGHSIDALKTAYEALKEENSFEFRQLTIFPGVEITTQGNVHILGIFPEDATSADINTIVDNCEYPGDKGNSNGCTDLSPRLVINKIVEKGGLAIPAHVEGPQGIFKELSGATLDGLLSNSKVIAMETTRRCVPPEKYFDNKLDWAMVTGSDQHYPDGQLELGHKFPGSHYTWIKMETPSWEELHQALLAHEVCVLDHTEIDPNTHPDIFLRSLMVQSMTHCGVTPGGGPLTLQFNPFFNAIIGGRGSGKSTILESIRIASRREDELQDMEMSKIATELSEFMRLSTDDGVMEPDTVLMLDVHRRGVEYRITWRQDSPPTLEQWKSDGWNGGEWQVCPIEGDIQERFPLDIYSQKQIYTLASDPKGLLAIIDRSPEVNRSEWQARWDTKESEYLQKREQHRGLLIQIANEASVNAQLIDVKNDLKQYEEKGHRQKLSEYQYRTRQSQSIPLDDHFNDLASRLRELSEQITYTPIPEGIFNPDDPHATEVKAVQDATVAELSTIQKELLVIQGKVEQATFNRRNSLEGSAWYAALKNAEVEYEKLIKDYEGKDSNLNDYNEWIKKRGSCEQELVRIAQIRTAAEKLDAEVRTSLDELGALRAELFERRNSFLKKTIAGNKYVQMELVPFGDTSRIETDYREIFNIGENVYESSILDPTNQQGILWELTSWEEIDLTGANIPALLNDIRTTTFNMLSSGQKDPNTPYVDARFPTTLQTKYNTNQTCLDKLYTWYPEDLLRVRHGQPGQEEFKALEKGSAGQKAAAILAFILNHGSNPLIIDQPEDDLDSELIYRLIVQQIRENKRQRQLILVTHNANIVVNGDAELVHVLQFGGGQIRSAAKGGLGQLNIRDKICSVMEGGKPAFKKRYKRIIRDN